MSRRRKRRPGTSNVYYQMNSGFFEELSQDLCDNTSTLEALIQRSRAKLAQEKSKKQKQQQQREAAALGRRAGKGEDWVFVDDQEEVDPESVDTRDPVNYSDFSSADENLTSERVDAMADDWVNRFLARAKDVDLGEVEQAFSSSSASAAYPLEADTERIIEAIVREMGQQDVGGYAHQHSAEQWEPRPGNHLANPDNGAAALHKQEQDIAHLSDTQVAAQLKELEGNYCRGTIGEDHLYDPSSRQCYYMCDSPMKVKRKSVSGDLPAAITDLIYSKKQSHHLEHATARTKMMSDVQVALTVENMVGSYCRATIGEPHVFGAAEGLCVKCDEPTSGQQHQHQRSSSSSSSSSSPSFSAAPHPSEASFSSSAPSHFSLHKDQAGLTPSCRILEPTMTRVGHQLGSDTGNRHRRRREKRWTRFSDELFSDLCSRMSVGLINNGF
jgi:hypothetical protein